MGDNIKMDLIEIGCSGINWTDLAQDRDQWRALVNKPLDSIKYWETLETTSGFSRKTQVHADGCLVYIYCVHVNNIPNVIMCLHGSQSAIMKNRHEKALNEIIEMLSEGQHIVAVTARSCVQPASLHAAAEATYRFASLLQCRCLLQDSCNITRQP
jgi:hypothetical protein